MNRRIKIFIPLLVILAVFIHGCAYNGARKTPPVAKNGVLDLRQWDLEKDGWVRLYGEWEFYWNRLVEPSAFLSGRPPEMTTLIEMPDYWMKIRQNGQKTPAVGYATHRLKILLPENPPRLALKFREVMSAYSVFVNGQKITTGGVVGTSLETEWAKQWPHVVEFETDARELDLVIHVSNFHYRKGGIPRVITFGGFKQVVEMRVRKLSFEVFLAGSLMIMALYHFGLFALRTREKSTLWFGILCLMMAVRTYATGETLFMHFFPNIHWDWFARVVHLPFYIGAAVFFTFIHSLFPNVFSKKVLRILQAAGVLVTVFALLTPARIYTVTMVPYEILALCGVLYAIYVLIRSMLLRLPGAVAFSLGTLVLFVTLFNDILYNNQIIHTGYYGSFGIFIFIFSQAFLLSIRFSSAFYTVERQADELSSTNEALRGEIVERVRAEKQLKDYQDQLEELVADRTKELEAANDNLERVNHELKRLAAHDPLTGLANRRVFMETLENEWRRASRSCLPMALIMMDVDYFKAYNDTYGHQEGDKCLKRIADVLDSSIRRAGDLVARYGGEEFALVMAGADRGGAERVAEGIRQAVEAQGIPHEGSKTAETVTVSLGVASFVPNRLDEPDRIIQRADEALYKAKRDGRNRVAVFSDHLADDLD